MSRETRKTFQKNSQPDLATENTESSIGDLKQSLLDPRSISLTYDRNARVDVYERISESRNRSRSAKENIDEKESVLDQIEEQTEALNSLKAEKVLELEQRLEKLIVRLKGWLKIKDKPAVTLETEVETAESEIESLYSQSKEIRTELEQLREQQSTVPDSRELLKAYYEKMETVPLTNDEKREALTPELLSSLSTQEYIALWRRLNPHFLSHVTRQGFRDHNAMIYHSGGLQEFHEGLEAILEDEKMLRPPLAVSEGLRSRDEQEVKNYLEDWVLQADDKEEAMDRLYAQLNRTIAAAPKYPDKTAVHFAAQIVADNYYGGERGNESFFVYPSDALASQHDFAFNGNEKDFTRPQSETKWNDVFIWPQSQDNPGIPVDAGIVFLPNNTPVDPETGSKYASEMTTIEGQEKRIMVEDEKMISKFVDWAENLNDQSPVIQAEREYDMRSRKTEYWARHDRSELRRGLFDVWRKEIMDLGFSEDAAMDITYSLHSSLDGMAQYEYTGAIGLGDDKREAALNKLRSASANWKRAKNPIIAKEYWENYFTENPNLRPKHVIYYDGDPTTAVYEFHNKEGIGKADVSETEGKLLGFDDRHVDDLGKDPRARVGYDELVETAKKFIDEKFGV